MNPLTIASCVSGVSFLLYGYQCIRSPFMEREFRRFKMARFRKLTGILEILGGIGVLVGVFQPGIGILSSLGLFLLMAMGVAVRIRVKDPILPCLPAVFFCVLNGGILFLHLSNLRTA